MPDVKDLERRFNLPGVAFDDATGLIRIRITRPEWEAEVFLQGAHIARFSLRGDPLLFMSTESFYKPGKALRGGVPIIFPWFGNHATNSALPAHGFARTAEWTLADIAHRERDTSLAFRLSAGEQTQELWPHEFALEYDILLGEQIALTLRTRNSGSSPFTFEHALHTYLYVADVHQVSVHGLNGVEYIDKTDGMQRKRMSSDAFSIDRETDSVFVNTDATCVVEDPVFARRIVIEKEGSNSTVVWNPWSEKAKAFSDFGDDEWQRMVCVESANAADNAITLGPGESHEMRVRLLDAGLF